MMSLQDSNYQAKITGVILVGRMYSVAANSPEILQVLDYDLPEAEKQLKIWQSRHNDDCDIVGKNPLTLSIRPTFFPDPELKIQREKYVMGKSVRRQ